MWFLFIFIYAFPRRSSEAAYIGGSSKNEVVCMKRKINCPTCGKWLFSVDEKTAGVVYIWCKQCKKEIEICLEPMSQLPKK
jgi:transcription elongation factor Elf1